MESKTSSSKDTWERQSILERLRSINARWRYIAMPAYVDFRTLELVTAPS